MTCVNICNIEVYISQCNSYYKATLPGKQTQQNNTLIFKNFLSSKINITAKVTKKHQKLFLITMSYRT